MGGDYAELSYMPPISIGGRCRSMANAALAPSPSQAGATGGRLLRNNAPDDSRVNVGIVVREELADLPDPVLGKCGIYSPERPAEAVQGLERLTELALYQ